MKTPVALSWRQEIPESPAEYSETSLKLVMEMLAELLGRLPGAEGLIKQKTILIKSNMVRPNMKRLPTIVTDPRVVIGLVRLLYDMGAKQVQVGDNPGYGLAARDSFAMVPGLVEGIEAAGGSVVYFDEVERVVTPNEEAYCFRDILTPKPVLDCDTFLNLPKLKTHMHTLVTLGLKNLQGIILDEQRLIFHRNDIHTKIVDTVRVRPPELTIIDGLWAMEGQAPFYGSPLPDFNTLVASFDIVAVDRVCCHLMGIYPEEVTHVRLARQAGLSRVTDDDIEVIGGTIEERRRLFRRPIISSVGAFDEVLVLEGGADLGAQSSLRHSLDKLHLERKLEKLPKRVMVYLGDPMPNIQTINNWEGDLWLFGNLASNLVFSPADQRGRIHYIPGAPPHVHDLYKRFSAEYGL